MSEVPLQVGLDARPGHEGALLSYSGSIEITTYPDLIAHCKTASGTNWSNTWTYRVLIIKNSPILNERQVGLDARPGHEGALLSSVLTPLQHPGNPGVQGYLTYNKTHPSRTLP